MQAPRFGLLLALLLILTQDARCRHVGHVFPVKVIDKSQNGKTFRMPNIFASAWKPEIIRVKRRGFQNHTIEDLEDLISSVFAFSDQGKEKRSDGKESVGTENKTSNRNEKIGVGKFGSLPLFVNAQKHVHSARAHGNRTLVLGNAANVTSEESNNQTAPAKEAPAKSKTEDRDLLDLLNDAKEHVKSKGIRAFQFARDVPSKIPQIINILKNRQKHDVLDVFDNMKEKLKETGRNAMKIAAKITNQTISLPKKTIEPKIKEFLHGPTETSSSKNDKRQAITHHNTNEKRYYVAEHIGFLPYGLGKYFVHGKTEKRQSEPHHNISAQGKGIKPIGLLAYGIRKLVDDLQAHGDHKNPKSLIGSLNAPKANFSLFNGTRNKRHTAVNKTEDLLVSNGGAPKTAEEILGENTISFRKSKHDTEKKMENGNSRFDMKNEGNFFPSSEMKNGIFSIMVEPIKEPPIAHKPHDLEEIAVGFEINYHDCSNHKVPGNKSNGKDGLMERFMKTTKKIFNLISGFTAPFFGFMDRKGNDKKPEGTKLLDIYDLLNISRPVPGKETEWKVQERPAADSGPHEFVLEGTPCKPAAKPSKLCKMVCKLYNYTSGRCNDDGHCTCFAQRNNNNFFQYGNRNKIAA